MGAEDLSSVQRRILDEEQAMERAWGDLARDADIAVESEEGVALFRGFTDEEHPEAAQWLQDRFAEMKDHEEPEPLPPAA